MNYVCQGEAFTTTYRQRGENQCCKMNFGSRLYSPSITQRNPTPAFEKIGRDAIGFVSELFQSMNDEDLDES